ncbi:putative mannosyl-oligosaccharide glucosidase [Hyphodiscus hymeniophilus]|uniref:Mannosyl-oligosaccharide glucosidase n=1 Tax=Hyphodiscus hymeniophilus TaxID=353542 RepID=A0A9P6VI83_9HELO|nr:putative mannosyl-oligosaccharide glucosidase [Hyphodiscus hymeniophilus]
MAEPPYKRARRPDSKQMWDESDRRAPVQSRERDEPPRERKDERTHRDNGDRDRNRRYRSRSPRDSRDRQGGRDRDRERGGRDSWAGGRGRDDRDRDGKRDERRDARDRGEYYDDRVVLVYRSRPNAQQDAGRDSRDKTRERSRSRDNKRRRSRSPRKERVPGGIHEEKPKQAARQPEEDSKERTATPPVSFKVGGQDHDRMDTDGDHKPSQVKGGSKKDKVEEGPLDDDDEIVVEDDGMAAMQAMMGFGGFGTTHQKKVPGNDISAVRKEKKTEYRQHTCEQSDGMQGYGWDEYDARTGGQQTIYDAGNMIDIKTMFVKIPGGSNGGSWGTRVRGTVRKDGPPDLKTTIVFYTSLEGLGSLEVENEPDLMGYEGDVTLKGESEGLGAYRLTVTAGRGFHPVHSHPAYKEKPLDRTMVHSFSVPENILWQAKPILFKNMKEQLDEYIAKYGEENAPAPCQVYTITNNPGPGNIHMIQKVFEGDFEFDIIYSSASAGKEYTSQDISQFITLTTKGFWSRFVDSFDPKPPFDVESLQRFSANMFSNLIGGLGYFYGDEVVDRSYAPEYDEENEGFWEETAAARAKRQEALEGPYELFTTVPSRPFFPRGFLWDEGFHLMPVIDFDVDLSLEVVKNWFNLMDDEGWIGREQILGPEARSKVPLEFQTQYPHYANPPTLFLILDSFVSKLGAMNGTSPPATEELGNKPSQITSVHLKNPDLAIHYLQELYPKLKKQFYWFRKTQFGDLKSYDRDAFSSKEAYRWRGRTPQHILTSGLDDYPRPQPPHPGELHVDLISWMGMMTKSLKNIATLLQLPDDIAEFTSIETAILRNIDDLHWSEKEKCYCDATIDDYEENSLVCHKGYISLFPFLLGLIDPKSEKLGHVLQLLGDEEELWSEYGIRSLSKKDDFYGTGENYWRGPVWMNMNYLAVSQLLKYAQTPGPHQSKATNLYGDLRINLVKTVYNQWVETGFAWEQYNPETDLILFIVEILSILSPHLIQDPPTLTRTQRTTLLLGIEIRKDHPLSISLLLLRQPQIERCHDLILSTLAHPRICSKTRRRTGIQMMLIKKHDTTHDRMPRRPS